MRVTLKHPFISFAITIFFFFLLNTRIFLSIFWSIFFFLQKSNSSAASKMHSTFEYQVIFTNGNINGDLYMTEWLAPSWQCLTTFAFLPCLKTLIIMYSYNWIVQNRTGIVIIFQLFTCNPHLMNKCADQVKSQINSLSLQERSGFSTFVFKIQSPIPTLFINNLPCYLCLWWNKRVISSRQLNEYELKTNTHPPTQKMILQFSWFTCNFVN